MLLQMATHNLTGTTGEKLAREYLEQAGYEILDENWAYGKAEIDLIAYKNQQIVFAEVKTRSGTAFGQPEDFVNRAKQKLMAQAANEYIYLMGHTGEIRFDVIAILVGKNHQPILKHIEDAFWPDE